MKFKSLQVYRRNYLVPVSKKIKNLDSDFYKSVSAIVAKKVESEDCVCVLTSPNGDLAIFISERGKTFEVTLSGLNSKEAYRNHNRELKRIPLFVERHTKTFKFRSLVNDFINKNGNIAKYKDWFISDELTLEQFLSLEG